jgi:hypothetical protein
MYVNLHGHPFLAVICPSVVHLSMPLSDTTHKNPGSDLQSGFVYQISIYQICKHKGFMLICYMIKHICMRC